MRGVVSLVRKSPCRVLFKSLLQVFSVVSCRRSFRKRCKSAFALFLPWFDSLTDLFRRTFSKELEIPNWDNFGLASMSLRLSSTDWVRRRHEDDSLLFFLTKRWQNLLDSFKNDEHLFTAAEDIMKSMIGRSASFVCRAKEASFAHLSRLLRYHFLSDPRHWFKIEKSRR